MKVVLDSPAKSFEVDSDFETHASLQVNGDDVGVQATTRSVRAAKTDPQHIRRAKPGRRTLSSRKTTNSPSVTDNNLQS